MKLAWTTDIHLDCVDNLLKTVNDLSAASRSAEGIIISGDISVGNSIVNHLKLLEDVLQKPIYFVLGNHDYYYSDIISTRKNVTDACRHMSFCRYLGAISFAKLDKKNAIIGSDGWYDAYNGDPAGTEFLMSDWVKIADFKSAVTNTFFGKSIDKGKVIKTAREICKASVAHIVRGINACVESSDHIIVVTHVPPFEESYTNGKYKDIPPKHVVPWYTSKMMGEILKTAAKTYPQKQFTVLSGHTHSSFEGDILPNLRVKVGKSQYGSPQIVGYIDI
jgi:Icc protein